MVRTLVLAGLILLMTRLPGTIERAAFPQLGSHFTILPHLLASSHTIMNGLSKFSHGNPELVTLRETVYSLGSLLLVFVVSPSLFYFSLRRYFLKFDRPRLPRVTSLLGTSLVISLVLIIIPATIVQFTLRQTIRNAVSVQTVKDDMINTVNLIALDASFFRVMPRAQGGGGGSYDGFEPSTSHLKTEWAAFSIRRNKQELIISGLVTKNPFLLWKSEDTSAVPEAGLSATLDKQGRLKEWTYTGLFR